MGKTSWTKHITKIDATDRCIPTKVKQKYTLCYSYYVDYSKFFARNDVEMQNLDFDAFLIDRLKIWVPTKERPKHY